MHVDKFDKFFEMRVIIFLSSSFSLLSLYPINSVIDFQWILKTGKFFSTIVKNACQHFDSHFFSTIIRLSPFASL